VGKREGKVLALCLEEGGGKKKQRGSGPRKGKKILYEEKEKRQAPGKSLSSSGNFSPKNVGVSLKGNDRIMRGKKRGGGGGGGGGGGKSSLLQRGVEMEGGEMRAGRGGGGGGVCVGS